MIFYKLNGAGNDFIFFINESPQPKKAKRLCDRHTGIGADGVVWLTHLGGKKFKWDFYNSDGSAAEMCGNAARCAMRLIHTEFAQTSMELETAAGTVRGSVVGKEISVSFDLAEAAIQEIKAPAGAKFPKGYFLTAGVPHCVIPVDKPFDLKKHARELAPFIKNKAFGKKGSNLTFANFKSDSPQTVTLERGVDDFTLACGTGVIATARVYQYLKKTKKAISLKTPGGNFTVKFKGLEATLVGKAEFTYKGELWNQIL